VRLSRSGLESVSGLRDGWESRIGQHTLLCLIFCQRLLWTLEWVVRGYVGIHRAPKAIQVDGCLSRRTSLHRFPLALSYLEPLRVTGPLQSLVLRTEDMWQKYKPFFIEVFGILNQDSVSPLPLAGVSPWGVAVVFGFAYSLVNSLFLLAGLAIIVSSK